MAKDRKSIYDFFPGFQQINLQEYPGYTRIHGYSPEVEMNVTFTLYENGEIFYKSESDGGEGPGDLIHS
jgi:hypothetical protein